jgi:hypothetical protein
MKEIITKCIKGGVALYDHATTLTMVVASDIHNIWLSKTNESLHLTRVFHHVDDGFGNSIKWMKYWHETMLTHKDACNKRYCE